MKYRPHKYQQYAKDFILDHPVCCLMLDMGLGKTLQVITFLWSEFQESAPGENRRALVITPASLVFNWMNEIDVLRRDFRLPL